MSACRPAPRTEADVEPQPVRAPGLPRVCGAHVGPRCWLRPVRDCALTVAWRTPARCDDLEPVRDAAARAYGHLEHRGRLVTPTRYPGRPGDVEPGPEPDWAGLAGGRAWEEPRELGWVEMGGAT